MVAMVSAMKTPMRETLHQRKVGFLKQMCKYKWALLKQIATF